MGGHGFVRQETMVALDKGSGSGKRKAWAGAPGEAVSTGCGVDVALWSSVVPAE